MSELTRIQALRRAAEDAQDMAGMVQVNRDDLRAALNLITTMHGFVEMVRAAAKATESHYLHAVDICNAESGEY